MNKLPLAGNLKSQLKQENDCWKEVASSLNQFDALLLRLLYYTGGSIGTVYKADAPMNVAFIRQASLKADEKLFIEKNAQAASKVTDIDLFRWDKEMQDALASAKYENQEKEFVASCGSISEYKQIYLQLEKEAVVLKALLAKWVSQRQSIEQELSNSLQGEYKKHTQKVINSLSYHIYTSVSSE